MKNRKMMICALLAVFASQASGEVEPYMDRIPGNTSSFYTVPEGKVLLIEYITPPSDDNEVRFQVRKSTGGGSSFYYFKFRGSLNGNTIQLSPPLRVPGGWGVRNFLAPGFLDATGLLVDTRDLYAAVVPSQPVEVTKTAVALKGEVKLASPRPVVMRTETSTDMKIWTRKPGDNTVRLANPGEWAFSQETAGATKKFLRLVARSRTKP